MLTSTSATATTKIMVAAETFLSSLGCKVTLGLIRDTPIPFYSVLPE